MITVRYVAKGRILYLYAPNKDRDSVSGDEAMMRRRSANWTRRTQPDPYDGTYNLAESQSLNRNAYVEDEPVDCVNLENS